MMRELADNILDIAQNSISARASLVEIDITVSHERDTVGLAFIDDGCGMSQEMAKAVCDPFTTTRKTRKVGLGLPLLKMTAQATGGDAAGGHAHDDAGVDIVVLPEVDLFNHSGADGGQFGERFHENNPPCNSLIS